MIINNNIPNFLVIGAPKSGTTSLFYYLKEHPQIYLPERKELHFFSHEFLNQYTNGPRDKDIVHNLISDHPRYLDYFKKVNKEIAIGEVSPSYLYYSDSAEKILKTLGKIKIIILLRNPVDKAYSQYMHLIRENRETFDFWSALMEENSRIEKGWSDIWRYAESSLYTSKVSKFLQTFGKDKVKVVLFEDFIVNTDKIYKEILQFLCVNDNYKLKNNQIYNRSGIPKFKMLANFFGRPSLYKKIGKIILPQRFRLKMRLLITDLNTGEKDSIDKLSLEFLKDYFRHDIQELEKLLKITTGWLND